MEHLSRYRWPGNIRELQSVLRQALLQASGTVLIPAFLPESLGGPGEASPAATGKEPALETFAVRQRLASDVRDLHGEAHRELDRLLLPRVLEYTGGNLQQAALILGIARQTLREKLRAHGLSVRRAVVPESEEPGG
jgi:two-component system nitrogen regulation response regulator GlnG